jgi:aldose 1-epimerase
MKKILVLLLVLIAMNVQSQSEVKKTPFGKTPDGTAVDVYTLTSGKVEVRIMTYGGIIVSVKTPDRNGKIEDIALGFDDLNGYIESGNKPYFGALVGRYANRLAHGTFTLDGKQYHITKNDGDNTLHGGAKGFGRVVWSAKQIPDGVEMTYVDPDGTEGFPGTLTTTVRYTLKNDELRIEYSAITDKDTVVNLTSHSYFNLAGEGNGTILKQQMELEADKFTPVDKTLIPTGELAPVQGTPLDFRKLTEIGARIDDDNPQLKLGLGYDHNWVLNNGGKFAKAAEAYDSTTGRVLQVFTDQPGIQFYSGNFLDGTVKGKQGHMYPLRSGFALETQHFPDSPNHKNFPSTELKPGQKFHSVTSYRFSVR